MQTVRLRVEDGDDLEAIQAAGAAQADVSVTAVTDVKEGSLSPQMDPVTAVLVAGGATLVVKTVLDWWDRRKGGLVIDQRAEDMFSRDTDVPYGYVVIIAADGGKVTVETKDQPKDALHQLLETLMGKVMDTAGKAADAAKEALGDDAKIVQA